MFTGSAFSHLICVPKIRTSRERMYFEKLLHNKIITDCWDIEYDVISTEEYQY